MTTRKCVHHWLIADPVDDKSKAMCKKCGRKRIFTHKDYSVGGGWQFTDRYRPNFRRPLPDNPWVPLASPEHDTYDTQ